MIRMRDEAMCGRKELSYPVWTPIERTYVFQSVIKFESQNEAYAAFAAFMAALSDACLVEIDGAVGAQRSLQASGV